MDYFRRLLLASCVLPWSQRGHAMQRTRTGCCSLIGGPLEGVSERSAGIKSSSLDAESSATASPALPFKVAIHPGRAILNQIKAQPGPASVQREPQWSPSEAVGDQTGMYGWRLSARCGWEVEGGCNQPCRESLGHILSLPSFTEPEVYAQHLPQSVYRAFVPAPRLPPSSTSPHLSLHHLALIRTQSGGIKRELTLL